MINILAYIISIAALSYVTLKAGQQLVSRIRGHADIKRRIQQIASAN